MAIFQITLRSTDGDDGIRIMRVALKVLLRRFGLKAIKIEEMRIEKGTVLPPVDSNNRYIAAKRRTTFLCGASTAKSKPSSRRAPPAQ